MYGGKFILRMDDTNPEAERMEYHAAIKVGLEWLGIEFDIIKNTSDDMELFYEKGIELINSGKAYVCKCKRDDISKNRRERKACKCSLEDIDKNNKNWGKMQEKFKPGEAVVRFRGDIKADNAVMRDPVLFRIIEGKHYTLGEKYRIWPSYDFAVAIEDSIDGITHAFRSKEFELREELTNAILDTLGMRKPHQGFFSRLEFKGMPISKRVIKPLIEEGKVSWYDDPRLPTLEALRRRGIKPEAIRKFIMSLGLTKANTLAPFDALEAFNRKFVDSDSIRLFMVSDAKKLTVNDLPMSSVEIPNHPINDMGKRKIDVDGNFYISGEDSESIKEGMQIRLLGLGNVSITKKGIELEGNFIEGEPKDIPKIQWVPQKTAHEIKMLVPKILFNGEEFNEDSLEELDVYTEPHYLQLKEGEEVQFVRYGYCRKDSQNQAIFTHK
jgi:glutamyl-tRNA synthetase